VRKNAKVVGRWHDNRHTLVTELAESGAGDEVIMSIAGHVSRAMLSRYSTSDGGEATRPRRDRRTPAHGRRKAQGGCRTTAAGLQGRSTPVSPVIAILAEKPVLRGATSSWIPFTGCLAVKMCCIFKRLARL